MISIDFGGHWSKMKVTIGIIDKCGVRGDAMHCVIIFDNVLNVCLFEYTAVSVSGKVGIP